MSQPPDLTVNFENVKEDVSERSSVTSSTVPFPTWWYCQFNDIPYIAGDPQSPQYRIPLRESNRDFSDGADPLFGLYLDTAEDEDQKMSRRWQEDADGILIFVSSTGTLTIVDMTSSLNIWMVIEWRILYCSCIPGFGIDTGPSTGSTGYVGILSPEHLPDPCRPQL